jgi:Zinc carboxypeptidase
MRAVIGGVAVAIGIALGVVTPAAHAQDTGGCDPFGTQAQFRGEVPRASEVIGVDLGERDVTAAESDAYVDAVDRASDRVVSSTLGRSVQGRPLRYAIVGSRRNVAEQGLERIRRNAAALRDPATSRARARRIAQRSPGILWIAGNVHGGEESGTDAALRVLYELADRSDCAARQILDEAVVVILPTQNPDGREADTRRNAYGFDLNRDWFARTQPETDAKVEFLRRYPPVLFIDAHEMGRENTFFFPPNADPIYHEISGQSVNWINNVYGSAMQAEFTRQQIPFFNYDVYDLFYEGYGDTVPSTAFNAAGMTYEKSSGDPTPRRVYEQYVAQWTSLSAAAFDKDQILADWHRAWVEAQRQGERGILEPNEVVQPENTVQRPVPDIRVRHYFIRADDPAKTREVQSVVRRLQRMDVQVRRLTRPLRVRDFKPYGRPVTPTTLPAGSYWIPMAQPMKHWVQAMLNEDTYTPFPYFYDVTAWSLPLLANVAGGYSGRVLEPTSARVRELADPGREAPPASAPRITVLQLSQTNGTSIESTGWLRWLLDQWRLPYQVVAPEAVTADVLAGTDVLLLPDGPADEAYGALGAAAPAVTAWVNAGGRVVGWRGGAVLAARLGASLATVTPNSEAVAIPGALFRTELTPGSPLATGVGPEAWTFYQEGYVLQAPDPATVAMRFPATDDPDFFVSGFAEGADQIAGTPAVVDERIGAGRSIVMSFEPNFRGFTDGTQELLRNAVLGTAPAGAVARVSGRARAASTGRATAAAARMPTGEAPLRLVVRPRGERAARALLARYGATYEVGRADGRVGFTIANPGGLSGDEHPYAGQLARDLREAQVPVLAFSAP